MKTTETLATLTVKASPFGPTFNGRSQYSNDPEGTWQFSVIKALHQEPHRIVFEVHGEKITGKGTGAKMDVTELECPHGRSELRRLQDQTSTQVKAMKLMRQRAEVVGGFIKDGELQLEIVEMTGGFLL